MTTNNTRMEVFRGDQDIMDYYDMSKGPAFEHYVKMGMPMRLINGSYHGYADNIDEWFRLMTNQCATEFRKEINERGEVRGLGTWPGRMGRGDEENNEFSGNQRRSRSAEVLIPRWD